MRWQEQLPKFHPLYKEPEAEEMSISPGTERAIQEMARLAPSFLKELEKLNKNLSKSPLTDIGQEFKLSIKPFTVGDLK